MPRLKALINPKSYLQYIEKRFEKRIEERQRAQHANLLGVTRYPPGHYYSPLLDIEGLPHDAVAVPDDGAEWWEHLDLRAAQQRVYYERVLNRFGPPRFPRTRVEGHRYFWENRFFQWPDAFMLQNVIREEQPRRILEVGSGFSSAVMLDTLDQFGGPTQLTFIEPDPRRLDSLLTPRDKSFTALIERRVQSVDLEIFDALQAQDVLFIDSSHVAKVGSDVAFLILRILPRLRKGVLVHFHDIFFPFSYPMKWIRQGRAWNESLMLRAFLIGNTQFEIMASNSFAATAFPELFHGSFDLFLAEPGASFWLRKRE